MTDAQPMDAVDEMAAAWGRIHPDLAMDPMQVVARILRASKLILLVSDARLRAVGLVRADFDVLASLRRFGGPLGPTALATRLLISAPSMTKRLRKLEATGLITRLGNPADRRGFLLELTPAGTSMIDTLLPEQAGVDADLLSELPPDLQRQLAQLLKRLLLIWEPSPPSNAAAPSINRQLT
jgi:DNA-binding MarR family transcriptional regulator